MIVADTYTHGCQKYSLEKKKREHRRKSGGLNSDITWIKIKQPNKLHFHFTSIIKKLQWLAQMMASATEGIFHLYFGSEHSGRTSPAKPQRQIFWSKFKNWSLCWWCNWKQKKRGDRQATSPRFSLGGKGGGKSEFSWLLSKHWHDPPMVSRFWFHAPPHLVPSVPSGFQTAKAEDSGCLVYPITDCNERVYVRSWVFGPVTCFSKGCKFIFKTLGTPVNGENPVRMAAALFFFPGAIWTILPFLCRSRISTVSHQDLCIHSRECTRKV